MFTIYALIFKDYKRIYVGMTEDLDGRVIYHRKGKVRSTKNRGDFCVKIIETCNSREAARKREKYWKSGCGKEKLKSEVIQRGGAIGSSGGS